MRKQLIWLILICAKLLTAQLVAAGGGFFAISAFDKWADWKLMNKAGTYDSLSYLDVLLVQHMLVIKQLLFAGFVKTFNLHAVQESGQLGGTALSFETPPNNLNVYGEVKAEISSPGHLLAWSFHNPKL
uniref:Uncharacterized protein n=1 Tax=Salix viminalis TaxID=40686 RepID=A0A6N2LHU6_SALVM